MGMTTSDFEATAAAVADADMGMWPFPTKVLTGSVMDTRQPLSDNEQERNRARMALLLADTFVSQADSFDPVRFIRDCGVSERVLPSGRIAMYSSRLRIRMENVAKKRR